MYIDWGFYYEKNSFVYFVLKFDKLVKSFLNYQFSGSTIQMIEGNWIVNY